LIASAHPYAGAVIGLATMHDKGRAVAPPFRRLLGARVLEVTGLDTDQLGTFSGDIARPASPVEVTDLKARMTFEAMDVDCAIASEGSYAPIDRVPLNAAGVEIMTFVDRKRGVVVTETLTTQRTNWRMQRFAAGDPRVEDAATALGLPRCGAIVMRNDDWSHPVKNLSTAAEVRAAIESEAPQSRDGLAVLIPDMRAHRNPWRMMAIRALAWRLARRLAHLCPSCGAPGWGHVHSPRGLPCESCGEPTDWIAAHVDGCSACGHAEARPRPDGRRTASKLSCRARR